MPDGLTSRECDVLILIAQGLSNKEIGARLSITEGTVKNHVHNALEKLGLDNRIQAASYIVRQGLGHSPDKGNIMYATVTDRTKLGPGDVAGVSSIPARHSALAVCPSTGDFHGFIWAGVAVRAFPRVGMHSERLRHAERGLFQTIAAKLARF